MAQLAANKSATEIAAVATIAFLIGNSSPSCPPHGKRALSAQYLLRKSAMAQLRKNDFCLEETHAPS
jgi:hypothetical protein